MTSRFPPLDPNRLANFDYPRAGQNDIAYMPAERGKSREIRLYELAEDGRRLPAATIQVGSSAELFARWAPSAGDQRKHGSHLSPTVLHRCRQSRTTVGGPTGHSIQTGWVKHDLAGRATENPGRRREGVLGGGGQGLLGEGLAAYYNNGHSCDLFILNVAADRSR